MSFQNCSFCSSIKNYERGFQKSGEGEFLPKAAQKLIVLYDLKPNSFDLGGNPPLQIPSSRLSQLWQCPQCETFYNYREDYEFLWGGSENEQILERLTDEQALTCLEKMEPTKPIQSSPPQLDPKERAAQALKERKIYIIGTLKDALASGDYEAMTEALRNLDTRTYDYPELIPILRMIADAKFYKFDDNGAGGFPRPDLSLKFSFKFEALSAIEEIKKNLVESDNEK